MKVPKGPEQQQQQHPYAGRVSPPDSIQNPDVDEVDGKTNDFLPIMEFERAELAIQHG